MVQKVAFLHGVGRGQLFAGLAHAQFVDRPAVAGQIVRHRDVLQRHVAGVLHRDRVGDGVAHLHVLGHVSTLRHDQRRLHFLGGHRFGVGILHRLAVGIGGILCRGNCGVLVLACQQIVFRNGVLSREFLHFFRCQSRNRGAELGLLVGHGHVLQRHVTGVLHRDGVGYRLADLPVVLLHVGDLLHVDVRNSVDGLDGFGVFRVGLLTLGAGAFGLGSIRILAIQQVFLGDGVLGGERSALALGQQVDGLVQVGLLVLHLHIQQVHVTGVLHHDGVGHRLADLPLLLQLVSGLGHADLGHLGLVEDVVAIHRSGVAFHGFLSDGVLDLLTVRVLLQAGEGVLPAVLLGNGLGSHHIGAVHHLHGDGGRTDALRVVQVVPGLLAGDAGLVGLVGVGHGITGSSVASHSLVIAFRHGRFFHGILDLNALAVLVKVLEGVGPVVAVVQFNGFGHRAISQQVDGHALGTDAILVVSVVPVLGHLHFGLFDLMGVLDVVVFVVRGVVSHGHLGDLVGDLLTLGVHGQVLEGVLPLVLGGHGLAGDQLVLVLALRGQQVHGDALRTDAILVVGVVPGLLTGNAGGLGRMGVGQVVAIHLGGVAVHSFLGDGVLDLLAHLALAILGQVGEAVLPAISRGGGGGGHHSLAVHQLHGDLGGSLAILVICVVPALHTGDLDGLGRMGVGQVVAIHLGGVAVHSFLGDGVLDLLAHLALAILGQVGEAVLPAISRGGGGGGHHSLAVHQLHGDLGGTDAILVVGVVPGLLADDAGGLGRVGVGDGVAFHLGLVAFHRLFGHGVLNGLASLVDRQVVEGVLPLAAGISRHGGALHLLAIGQQVHGDLGGTLAILVVSVVPDLLAGDAGGSRLMGVDDVGALHLGGVDVLQVLGQHFLNGVLDLLASHMSGQLGEGVLPVAVRVSGHGGRLSNLAVVDRLHSSHQVHGDALGTQAILVVVVVPDLLAGNAGLARRVAVGDGVALDLGGVFIHLVFGHGVGDQLAIGVSIQIGEAELPVAVHIRSHISAVDLGAVGQQVHLDAGGTLAILVVSVAPDLLAAHRGLDDLVGVGDVEAVDAGFVAIHRSLGDGVGDILTRRLHRQVGEGMLPLAILIGNDGRLVHLRAIGQQLHLDAGGTLAILVVLVSPGLGHLDLGGGRSVGVDQRHGSFGLGLVPGQFLAGGLVAFHSDLFDAVGDLLTLLVLVEIGEAPRPALLGVGGGVHEGFAILQQVDGDALGTQAVLVVGILPFLGAVDAYLLDLVGVGDVVAIDAGFVAIHGFLGDGVLDRHTFLARLVHRQVVEAPLPAVLGGHGSGVDLLTISQQVHGDALGTLAVLVVLVRPGLGAFHRGGVDGVGVSHGIAGRSIAGHGHGVASRHGRFCHGILDLNALAVLVKVLEGVGPFVVGVQFNRLAGSLAISQQVDGHARGALVVLVVSVVPDLGHLHFGLFDLVGVGDVVAVHLGGVDIHQLLVQHFLNAVGDLCTLGVSGQVGEAVLPAVGSGHGGRVDLLAVSQQVHGDGSRPLAILVVLVVPGLGAGNAGHARSMGVGDGVAVSSGAGDLRIVARHSQLLDGVGDLLAALILGQLGELPVPAVLGGHFLAGHGLAVGSQLDGDLAGTQAILVVLVLPDLGPADLSLLGGMGVGHGEASLSVAGDVGGVALHLILGNGVVDGLAVLVHRQVVEAELPIGGFVHCSHLALNGGAVGQQADGHALLADSVLVVLVVPHLGAFHLGGVDLMGVGDGVALGRVAGDDRRVIAFHLLLGHGVAHSHALGAFLIDRKRFEGSTPVGCSQFGGLVLIAISQQLHGDGSRTQAVAVAVVVPHLGHGHAGLAGRVDVLHIVALHIGGVVGHSALGDGVGDFIAHLARFVLGQVGEAVLPFVSVGHGLGVDDLAVSQQVDGDVLRTDARHVVEVVPGLLARHGDRLNGVSVGHVVASNRSGVVSHRILGDGVNDLLAALVVLVELVLGQVGEAVLPFVSGGHLLGFLHGAVSQQVDGDLGGTLAILVVRVVPGLGASHRHHGGRMGVLDVIASNGLVIASHIGLVNRVDDRRAALAVLDLVGRQVGEAVLPAIGGGHFNRINHLAVSQQLHGDAFRTQAILVVRVVPGLGAFHLDRSGSMAVGDGKAIDGGGVVIHLILADGVDDLHALAVRIAILGQASEAVLPFALLVGRDGRHLAVDRLTVSVQTHGDLFGAQAILVVLVLPGLGHADLSLLGRMGVGDGKAVDAGGVASHRILGDGVHDLRAARILGQLGEGVLPNAISAEGSFLNLSAIGQQVHGDGAGTDAVLIVAVHPGLGHGHRGQLCVAGVGHGHGSNGVILVPSHGHNGILVVSHLVLGDGVVNQRALLVLVEIGEAELPLAIDLGHFLGRHNIVANLQVDGDACGTLAILVVRIVPHLGAGDADLLRSMGIGDVEAVDGRFVAVYLDLVDGVLDQSTLVAILGQAGEAVRPVALGIGGNGSSTSRLVVSQQLHGDAGGTLAVLVVVVVPGLGAGDGSSLGIMGIGHGEASGSAAGDGALVALNLIFRDGVLDLFSLIVLVQAFEGSSPVVVSIQHNRLVGLLAISQQVDGHARGTDAVLVVAVLPHLLHGHRGLLSNVGVGHVVAALGDLGCVLIHRLLGDGVLDGGLHAVHILVLGQVVPRPSPAILGGHGLGSDLGAIRQQVDGDLRRPHLVAVAVISPGLAAGNGRGFRRVGVGDGNVLAFRLLGRAVAFRHSHLSNGIGNKLAISILVQASKVMVPFVVLVQHSSTRRFTISQQLHSNAGRTSHVAVVAVVPNLGHVQVGLARCVGVGDVHAGNNRSVTLRHASFLHAIADLLAHRIGAILQHIGERIVPDAIGIRLHLNRLANSNIISIQLHSDLVGALAVLIVVVVPGLGAAHADLLRRVGVGDVVVVDRSRVAYHRIFSDGVHDLLARRILGLVGKLPAPTIGGRHFLAGHFFAIGSQPDGDLLRTDAILVVRIDPGLGAGNVDGLGSMGVGNDNHTILDHRTSLGVVFRHTNFIHRPFNGRGGARVLGQAFEGVTPGVLVTSLRSSQSSGLIFFAVLLQLHLDAGGTDAILVVIVVPHLLHGHFRSRGGMGVGNGDEASFLVLGVGRSIALRHNFFHGVGDRRGHLTRPLVHGQVDEAPSPVILGSRRGGRLLRAISIELNGHAFRTDAVLVVSIAPRLDAGNVGGVRLMGVLDGDEASFLVLGVGRSIALRHNFFHGVNEFLTAGVLIQRSAPSPVVLLGRLNSLHGLAIQQNVDGHSAGTQVVLVVGVVPFLHAGNGDLFRLMGVGNGEAVLRVAGDLGGIASHLILGHGIHDLRAVLLDEEATPRHGQFITSSIRRNGLAADLFSLVAHRLVEGQRHGLAHAILVVLVVPNLGGGHRGLGRIMLIGNDEAAIDGTVDLGRIARRHLGLNHSVPNGLASAVLGQASPLIVPFVGFVQGHRGTLSHGAGHQLHSHVGRTEAVAVVVVIPDLGDLHGDRIGSMRIGNDIAVDGGGVVGYIILADGVDNFLAIRELGQTSKGVLPVAVCFSISSGNGRRLVRQLNIIGIQPHDDAGRTHAILVVRIVPDLGHFHRSLFRLVGVGDNDLAICTSRLGRRVASRHANFISRPNDGRGAVIVLGQILEGMAPSIARAGQHIGFTVRNSILVELHSNAARTDAILVAVVFPHLLHGDFRGLGRIGVGQGGHGARLTGVAQRVAVGQTSRVFLPGVGDRTAIGIHRKILNGSSPVITLAQSNGRNSSRAVGQSDSQALRTDGILIFIVVPLLDHGSFRGVGVMGVGNGQATFALGVAIGGVNFLNSPHDRLILDAVILGQIGDGLRPFVAFASQVERLTIRHAIGIQLQLNRSRTNVILVAVVFPHLLHGHFRGSGNMTVRNDVVLRCATGDILGIAVRHSSLVYGIGDSLASSLLVQVGPSVSPGSIMRQRNSLALGCAIGIQLHLNRRGTNAILVTRVIPRLGYGHAGLARRALICNSRLSTVGYVAFQTIARRHSFRPGVGNLLANFTLAILGQFGNSGSPIVGLIQSHSFARIYRISQQLNGQALRTDTILVLVVVPHLQHGGGGRFQLVRVGDGEIPALHIASLGNASLGNGGSIVGHSIFANCIGNNATVRTLSQIFPLDLPAVVCTQLFSLNCGTICLQVHSNAFRPLAILVVGVFPHLVHGNRDGLGNMGVGQGGGGVSLAGSQRVATHGVFRPGIFNFLSISILGQIGYLGSPVVVLAQGNGLVRFHIVCQQLNNQLFRTDAILIILVLPHLLHGGFRGLGGVGVGHGQAISGRGIGIGNIGLNCGVRNSNTICVHRQIREGMAPLVARTRDGSRVNLDTICIELDGHAGRTEASSVAVILPLLGHGHISRINGVSVGHSQAS